MLAVAALAGFHLVEQALRDQAALEERTVEAGDVGRGGDDPTGGANSDGQIWVMSTGVGSTTFV
jgi:hypothetical protein